MQCLRREPLIARSQLGLQQMFNCNGTPSVVLRLGKRMGKPLHELVEQAERFALANIQTPFDIPTLCRTLAVNERTLRKAFQKIRGLPPCRRLRPLSLGAFPLSIGKLLVKVLRKRLVGVSQPTDAAAPLTVAWGPPSLMLAKY